MRRRCQACGVLSSPSAKFCRSCGAELAAEPEQPPSGLLGLPCPACGADTRAGAQFCTVCGASLPGARPREEPPSGGPAPDQPVGSVRQSRKKGGREGSRAGLWIGGGVAAAVVVAAAIVVALVFLVGDDGGDRLGGGGDRVGSDEDRLGGGGDRLGSDGELGIVLQIIPGAVLLGQDQTTETLTLHAFDSNGDEIVVDTLAIEWMSSDSDIVSVVPDPDDAATATVTALKPTGTAMVTARLKSEPRVVTPLVTVTRAKLHPDVDLVADDDVIFPPPNLPDGMELSASQLPGVTLAGPGEEAQFGGFSESELANLFEVTDDFEVQYPIVLRGGAPSVGQRLLASGGAVIAGVVLSAEQRGDFSLVQLRVAAPQELFEELDFEMSAEKLVKDGLLMPFDTSGLDADNTNVRSGSAGRPGIAVKMASPLPQTVKEEFTIDPFKCTARIRPTFTIPRLSDDYFGPIWEPKLVIRSYTGWCRHLQRRRQDPFSEDHTQGEN